MKRSLALVLAVLLLSAGVWAVRAFLGGPSQAGRAAFPEVGLRAAAPAPTAAVLDQEPDVARTRSAASVNDSARAAIETAAPSEVLALQAIEVVDRLTREPLAGVRLRFAVVARGLVLEEHPGWKLETCDAWFEEHGSEAHSDPDGRAELRAPAGSLLLVAGSAPQRYGRMHCELQPEKPQTLVLEPDTTLEVLTVDAGGAALAGASVALRQTQKAWGAIPQHMRTSAADGRVVYPHVGLTVDLAGESWALVAPSLLGRVDLVELDPRALPDAPVRLVFPATGSVEVRVVGAPGLPPIEDDAEVSLLQDEGRPDELLSFWTRPDSVRGRVEDGVARFDFVPLGLDLIVEALPDGRRVPTRVRGRGPDAAGRTATLTIAIGSDHPVLRVRLVDAEGAALAERGVRVRLDEPMSQSDFELESDELGRVHIDVPANPERSDDEAALVVSVAAQDGAPAARAKMPLPDGLQPGLNDLGDLVLAADRPLVGGRVVGPEGSPLEGIAIEVAALRSWGEGQSWVEELPVSGESGADGSFAIYGDDPESTLRVTAQDDRHRSAPVDCAAGSMDLVIELVIAGNVAGRVRLDEGLDPALLGVRMHPAHEGLVSDYRRQVHAEVQSDGSFQVWGLAPGLWDLKFRDSVGGLAVAGVDGIEVPAGEASRDPRLAEIDLRGRLAVVRLILKAPRASDLIMGSLIYRPAGSPPGGEDQSNAFLHDSNVVLWVAGSAADVSVIANGFRAVELAGVRGEVTVELQRGPAVRLRLPAGTELPKPPRFLKPYLTTPEDASPMGGHFQQVVFDGSREVLLYAPTHGRLQVQWFLEERSENSLSTSSIESAEPQWIEVLDLSSEQVFEVLVPDFGA